MNKNQYLEIKSMALLKINFHLSSKVVGDSSRGFFNFATATIGFTFVWLAGQPNAKPRPPLQGHHYDSNLRSMNIAMRKTRVISQKNKQKKEG
jgi:hypothetical protein